MKHSHLDLIQDWPTRARSARYSCATLAGKCCVSDRHLRRYILQEFGRTPHDLLSQLRLWDAARLLCEGNRIKEVTFDLGFDNSANFCRAFKEYHGCTPSEFVRFAQQRQRDFLEMSAGLGIENPAHPPLPWSRAEFVLFFRTRIHADVSS